MGPYISQNEVEIQSYDSQKFKNQDLALPSFNQQPNKSVTLKEPHQFGSLSPRNLRKRAGRKDSSMDNIDDDEKPLDPSQRYVGYGY
jgi:hypothetical protein